MPEGKGEIPKYDPDAKDKQLQDARIQGALRHRLPYYKKEEAEKPPAQRYEVLFKAFLAGVLDKLEESPLHFLSIIQDRQRADKSENPAEAKSLMAELRRKRWDIVKGIISQLLGLENEMGLTVAKTIELRERIIMGLNRELQKHGKEPIKLGKVIDLKRLDFEEYLEKLNES